MEVKNLAFNAGSSERKKIKRKEMFERVSGAPSELPASSMKWQQPGGVGGGGRGGSPHPASGAPWGTTQPPREGTSGGICPLSRPLVASGDGRLAPVGVGGGPPPAPQPCVCLSPAGARSLGEDGRGCSPSSSFPSSLPSPSGLLLPPPLSPPPGSLQLPV